MRRSLTLQLRRRLSLVAVLSMMFAGLATALVGMAVAQAQLEPELELTGSTVANALARDLGYAHTVGIPLEDYLGMDAYLRSVVDDAPTVRMVSVADPSGRVMYQYGSGAAWALHTVTVPLVADGRTVGQVRVSLDRLINLTSAGVALGLMVVLTAVLALAALRITAGLATAAVFEPLGSIGRALIRGSRGDFRVAPRRGGWGAPRSLAQALNAAVERLRHDWQSLRERAMAARAAHFDPAILAQVDRTMDRLIANYELPIEDSSRDCGLAARGGLQFTVFLLVVAEAICLSAVAHSPLQVSATWATALLMAALPVGLMPVSGRSAIISGALVAALGYVVAAGVEAGAGLIGARIVIGIGLGTALRSVSGLAAAWRGLLATMPMRGAILSGMAAGPLLGGLLSAELSPAMPFAAAAAAAGCAVLVGRWLPPGDAAAAGAAGLRLVLPLAALLGGAGLLLGAVEPNLAHTLPGWGATVTGGLAVSLAALLALGLLALARPRRTV